MLRVLFFPFTLIWWVICLPFRFFGSMIRVCFKGFVALCVAACNILILMVLLL